jgi:hypothetical protein
MGTLSRENMAIFEEHSCKRCNAAVEDAEHYVRGMKIADQRVRREEYTSSPKQRQV